MLRPPAEGPPPEEPVEGDVVGTVGAVGNGADVPGALGEGADVPLTAEQCSALVPHQPNGLQHSPGLEQIPLPTFPLPHVSPPGVGPGPGGEPPQCSALVPHQPYWLQHSPGLEQILLPTFPLPHVPPPVVLARQS